MDATTAVSTGAPAHLELAFSPSLHLVSTVRRFVSDFCMEIFANAEIASQVGLAAHELLENGTRYSIDGRTSIRVEVSGDPTAPLVLIETRNRASSENLSAIRKLIDEISSAPDALEHYRVLMERNMKRTDGSGLGLGRIRAESEMDLSYELDDNVLKLRALGRFGLIK